MGQKISKASLLEEIDNQIRTCELYQAKQPDPSAQQRVATLDKDPCAEGDYHAVMTLKGTISEKSTKPEDLLSEREMKYMDVNIKDYEKIFICGCIIKYNLKMDKITVQKFEGAGLSQLFEKLIEHNFEKGAKILRFMPSKGSIFSSFIKYPSLKDDYDSYKESYDVLYYSFGRFSNIGKFLEDSKCYEAKLRKLHDYSLPFEPVTYVNKTRLTSFEKNVNNEIDPAILNEVTNLNQKTEQGNLKLASESVYDFGNFILKKMSDLERSDNRIIAEFMANHSKKSSSDAKYDAYKNGFSGGTDWPNWATAVQMYTQFKSLSSSNKNFYENSIKNTSYKNNLKAQEETAFLFNNNTDGIRYFYNPSSIKKFTVSSGSSTIKEYVEKHFADPERIVVKSAASTGSVDLIFNKDLSYKLIVPVPENDKSVSDEEKTNEEFIFLTDKETGMVKAQCIVESKNDKSVDRDQVLLNGNTYKLLKNPLSLTDGSNALDEIAMTAGPFIEGYTYYNDGLKTYFKATDLIKRLTQIRLNYVLVPHEVNVQIKSYCIESSKYKETVVEALKKEQTKRGNLVLRACVDTIPHDPWEVAKNKLKKVYYAFAKIQANKDGYILVPPIESDQVKAASTKCKKCDKTKDICQCEDIKLCDKVFPVDLFGVTGLLGLDELLSKFGAFTAEAFVVDQNDNKLNYAEAAQYFYRQIYPSYDEFGMQDIPDVSLFEEPCNTSNLVKDISYEDIKSCPDFDAPHSIASQLSKDDFNRFIKNYSNLLDKKDPKLISAKSLSRELKIGISDGYAYIPIGRSVTYYFNFFKGSFNVKGFGDDPNTKDAQLELFKLIGTLKNGSCEKYVDEAFKLKEKFKTAFDKNEDAQINLAYPYKPDIFAMLGQSSGDNEADVDGYNFAYVYIPTPESAKRLLTELGKPKDIELKFDIYLKEPIKCGFPKNKNPKCRTENGSNGKCGLEELFKNPINVGTIKFDFDIEMNNLKNKVTENQIKKAADEAKQNLKNLTNFSCDIEGNLDSIAISKNDALDALYTVGKELAPIMNLFPIKCLTNAMNDGKNAICSASRKAQDKSVIDDFNDSFTHKLKTAEILAEEAWSGAKQKFNNVVGSFKNAVGPMTDSMEKLYDNASIYNLCPQRFGDYISDSGIAKSFGEGLTGIMKNSTMEILKSVLGSCMVDGIIDSSLGAMNSIVAGEKAEIKKILENGDPNAIDELGKKYPELLEKFGKSDGGLDFNQIVANPQFNTSFLQSFNTEVAKRMNPSSLMTSVKDKFTDPSNLVNFAQSGVKNLIKNGSGDMTANLMQNALGLGLEGLGNQVQGNLSNILSKENSKAAVSADLISSINTFVREKADLYSKINSGEKIPNLDV